MNKIIALLCVFAISSAAQTPAPPPVQAPPSVPVYILINWPPAALVAQKYGPLPKWAIFGEVIGCNRGNSSVTFGEGDVIAAIRASTASGGFDVFSRLDALQLVSNSQNSSKKNTVIAWIKAASMSVIDAKATGLIGSGTATGVAIVIGASLVNVVLPNAEAALNLKQLVQYSTSGIAATMAIGAGRCSAPMDVLFGTPANTPPHAPPAVTFQLNVPINN